MFRALWEQWHTERVRQKGLARASFQVTQFAPVDLDTSSLAILPAFVFDTYCVSPPLRSNWSEMVAQTEHLRTTCLR